VFVAAGAWLAGPISSQNILPSYASSLRGRPLLFVMVSAAEMDRRLVACVLTSVCITRLHVFAVGFGRHFPE